MHALSFIWHQFHADTRRHFWFIVGYAGIVAVFTGVDAALPFEYTSDNRAIRTWITLLPAVFMVPFLVFADPVDAPDAFWRVKPVSSLSMAGAKLLWISVWLILMPLIGECFAVVTLGSVAQLPYVAHDYIGFRAMVLLIVFAMAALTNQPFKFVSGLVVAFLSLVMVGVTIVALLDRPRMPNIAEIAKTNAIGGFVIFGSLAVAVVQYQWRRAMVFGIPVAFAVMVGAFVFLCQDVDLSDPPSVPQTSEFSSLKLKMLTGKINAGKETLEGDVPAVFRMTYSLDDIPSLGMIRFGKMNITIQTDQQSFSLNHLPQYNFKAPLTEDRSYMTLVNESLSSLNKGVQQNIRHHIKSEKLDRRESIVDGVYIPLPNELELNVPDRIQVRGTIRFDCFTYEEFGQIPIDTDRLTRNVPLKKITSFDYHREGNLFRFLWPSYYRSSPNIQISRRHINTSTDPANLDTRTIGPYNTIQWYFFFYHSTKNILWENSIIASLHCHANAWSSAHIDSSYIQGPEDLSFDKLITYKGRYEGWIEQSFEFEIFHTP